VNFVQIVSFFYSNISFMIRKEKTMICTSHVKTKHKKTCLVDYNVILLLIIK
jgi:hypothetical protein